MSKEMENKAMEQEQPKPEAALQPDMVDGKPLPQSNDKEFFLIKGIKAIWHGAGKVKNAIGDFVSDHPWIGCGASAAIGVGAKILYDQWMEDDAEADGPTALPEAEESAYTPAFEEDDFTAGDET